MPPQNPEIDAIATELVAALERRQHMGTVTERHPGFDVALAYRVTAAVRRLREANGDRVVGRKIGFTNRTIWTEYGVNAPIWGYVYDATLHKLSGKSDVFDLAPMVQPRIEPEIVCRLSTAPETGMDERALLSCVEWVAHGFEIVQCHYPAWRFKAPDTVAGFGLHGALLLGEPEAVSPANAGSWHDRLSRFEVRLMRDGEPADAGHGANVLGGPLSALRHLVEVLARDPDNPALAAGEIVTTGTLTRAFPVQPGEKWSTRLDGLPLAGIEVSFR